MTTDWSRVRVLEKVAQVRAYLAEVHGIRVTVRTLYYWSNDDRVAFPLHPPGREAKGGGTRGIISTDVIDEWVKIRWRAAPKEPVR